MTIQKPEMGWFWNFARANPGIVQNFVCEPDLTIMDSDDEFERGFDEENHEDDFQTWTMKDSVIFLIDCGGLYLSF